ncbi:hypothetical protein E2C01_059456 [Portunus trituberculatus]|uniref:Uncharacterized protein n=1 Tax=Portunus trituberculatus TaxID=210409 RepID=A0A5B7H5E6_PORTR|nr:hypothetical protein [Portunus trituberculatus]
MKGKRRRNKGRRSDRQTEPDVVEAMGDEFTVQVGHTLYHADCPQVFTKGRQALSPCSTLEM